MPLLIDTSLWVDFVRPKSPESVKKFIAPYILRADAHLAEPVIFEILKHATPAESRQLTLQFQTFPTLPTPPDLWTSAARLGQECRKNGVTAGSLDLLIATVALHHDAEIVTFDADFQKIAGFSALKVKLLRAPP